MLIAQDTLKQIIDVHMRADPYSPYGIYKASWEACAMRATNPSARRALWLEAARHWREVMRTRLAMRSDYERGLAFRAYKFARIAISSAHYA